MKPQDSLPPSDWLADIFAESHVAIGISHFADGRFVTVNKAFERLFGHRRKDIIGHTSQELGLWPFPEERAQLIAAIRNGEAVSAFEARYRKRSGEIGDLQISASIFTFDGVEYLVGQLTDISERKRAEEHLRLQSDILENLEEGVSMVSVTGTILYANPKFARMFGYADGDLHGRDVAILNAPDDSTPEETARQILASLRHDGYWRGDLKNRRKDGTEFWTHANVSVTLHPKFGEVLICAQEDITVLRRAQEERNAAYRAIGHLADHVHDEMEGQRRELAREVHDQIGATLTGIRMHLEALLDGPCREELLQVRAQLDQALATTRALCTQLRPPMLDDLGLAETLRWYVRDWSHQSGIRASVRITALASEPADPQRTDLFRMLQELLTNVARHAGAQRISISLGPVRGGLQLRVRDDGCGFPADQPSGFGLLGIRERLRRHGGTMRIDSAGQGSTVTLRIPG